MDIKNIGRYEIVGELGRGGMGVVYRAIDPTIRRAIALKTLHLDSQSEKPDEVLRRFRHEAQLAGGMNHPNIVTIYDAGDDGSLFYIAMEFIEGRTLQAILQEQRLTVEQILLVSRQITSALDYASARGVVHRDIKPANIMGTSLDSLKIMDFGIAKSDLGLTMTGQILGTPAYMSPEQVMGRPLDGRSDLFSFAVILYQMVTGEMPFAGNTATTIIYKIANEKPVAPSDLDVTVHPGLSAVITKALSKDPDERFQTGADLIKALENYKLQPTTRRAAASAQDAPTVTMLLQAEPTRAMPASPSGQSVQPQRPSSSVWKWPLIVVAALLLAALGYFGLNKKRASSPPGPITQSVGPVETRPEPTPVISETAAQPEPKPSPQFAELHIASKPQGATVTIDGKNETGWVTPFSVKKLSPGVHHIEISLQDYLQQARTVRLSAGEAVRLNVELTMSGGTLELNSTPAGAFILLDGKRLPDQQTPAKIHVTAGQHTVMLRMPGYREENTSVDIKDGETYPYSTTLSRNAAAGQDQGNGSQQEWLKKAAQAGKGIIAVFSEPPGASITVNGRSVPKVTPFRFPVPPGEYQVTISLDGYTPVQRLITVELGKPTRVQVRLLPR